MREILFRGKRVDNGEWVYGAFYAYYDFKRTIVQILTDRTNGIPDAYEVIPESVGQYTGLTVNGKKIFEGDIISIPFEEDRSPWEENCIYYENGEVYFDTMRHGWYIRFFDGEELSIWEYDEVDVVVVGNIHDNSELLKEGAWK
jgi:uncharacterized phage protein (TIGR01671 family)